MIHPRLEAEETFEAWGHPNIWSTHRTTLMVTRDEDLTLKGDCIVAILAEKSLDDLDLGLKDLIRDSRIKVTFTIEAGDSSFEVSGWGDPQLPLSDPTDMVIRKSSYVCGRTLMIKADKAACDIPRGFVELLQEGDRRLRLKIRAESVTQKDETHKEK